MTDAIADCSMLKLMYSVESLKISGYHDEPVPNTFFRQEDKAHHLAILLPGLEYTCQMPLLYYPACLLLILGADILQVEYAYNLRPDFQALPNSEQLKWSFTDATAACSAALAQRPYEQVTLIGKSIGTLAMGHLLTTEAKLAPAQAVWLTPLLRNDNLRSQIKLCGQRSLFIIGTADPHYSPNHLAELQKATKGEVVVIEGADHSLEIKGKVSQSLKAMEQVIDAMQAFFT